MKLFLRTLVVIVALSFTNHAKAQTFTSAVALNDYFATITDTLYQKGVAWGEVLGAGRKNKNDFSKLPAKRIDLENFLVRTKVSIKKMKDYKGSEEYRKSILDFLEYESELLIEAFLPFEKLGKTPTDAAVDVVIQGLIKASEKEAAFLDKVRTTQAAYAEKNGFTIQQ
jgi:hypothetical protein